VDKMSKIVDAYLPSCHAFIGQIFVRLDWKTILHQKHGCQYIPILLRLIVKLSAEPSVRQVSQ
jgi:hypothetical protein